MKERYKIMNNIALSIKLLETKLKKYGLTDKEKELLKVLKSM